MNAVARMIAWISVVTAFSIIVGVSCGGGPIDKQKLDRMAVDFRQRDDYNWDIPLEDLAPEEIDYLFIDYIKNYDPIEHGDHRINQRSATDLEGALSAIVCRKSDALRRFLEEYVADPSVKPRDTMAALRSYQLNGGRKEVIFATMKRVTDAGHNGFLEPHVCHERFGVFHGAATTTKRVLAVFHLYEYRAFDDNSDTSIDRIWDPSYLPTYEYLLAHLKYDSWRLEVINFTRELGEGESDFGESTRQRIERKLRAGSYAQDPCFPDSEGEISGLLKPRPHVPFEVLHCQERFNRNGDLISNRGAPVFDIRQ